MNLDIVTLSPTEWSKETWRDAYAQYCRTNMFGPKTKRQYYDFVLANHKRLEMNAQPLSDDLRCEWTAGWRNAVQWAKKHCCGRNGELLTGNATDDNLKEIKDDIRELQWDVKRLGNPCAC
jgi:hypothetical protein